MDIEFPGGMRVDVIEKGFRIRTDQPASCGGGGSAPSPFDLFLASIGACAGFYVLRFCQEREIDTEGLSLTLNSEWDGARKLVSRIGIEIALPPSFPEKYVGAVVRTVDQCSVKRHLAQPPAFDVVTTRPALALA